MGIIRFLLFLVYFVPAVVTSRTVQAPVRAESTITLRGSDTMLILGQRLSAAYFKKTGKQVVVTGGGSGTGAACLQNGSTDIAQMSRPLDSLERAKLSADGKEIAEIVIAHDGIAVLVHESNPCACLTLDELCKIFSGTQERWDAMTGDTIGARIALFGRESGSGTQRVFAERVLHYQPFAARLANLPGTASVVNAVREDPFGIGYGGIAYARGVKVCSLKVDAASPASVPTRETVLQRVYPLSRELYWYASVPHDSLVAEFISFALSEEGKAIIEQSGYFVERASSH